MANKDKVVHEIAPTILEKQEQAGYKQMRVAAYCRVSTDSDEQEMSFGAQVEYYTDKIMRNPEWRMAGIFADEGISGTQAARRPEFMRMIRMCRQGKIDMIVTKSVSRFARNTVDCLTYVRELKALGIPVIFEKEGLNTLHSASEIYISMHGIFAQSESESLSGNVRMGKAISAKRGKVTFSYKSFLGYRQGENGCPEIVPEQAAIVRRIYDRYLAGASLQNIADELTAQGIPTPMGKSIWTTSTIRSILTNEKYKGDALLQKTYVVDCISHKSKKNDDRPQYYVENSHPAIISREQFDRVQEEMARRVSKPKTKELGTKTEAGKYSSKFALTERLVCGYCGSPYRRCTWSKNGKKRIVWRCISRLDYGTKYCKNSPTLDEVALQRATMEAFQRMVEEENNQTSVEKLKLHLKMYYEQGDETSTVKEEQRMQELISAISQAAGEDDGLSPRVQGLVAELNKIKAAIAEKREKNQTAGQNKGELAGILNALDSLKNGPIEFDDKVVRQLVEQIRVESAEKIRVVFKGGMECNVFLSASHAYEVSSLTR